MSYAIAAVVAVLLSSLSDWYFFGILFHPYYQKTPGVWRRYDNKRDEMRSITISSAYQGASSVFFVVTAAYLGIAGLERSLTFAILLFLTIPLPLFLSQSIFIPMHKRIVASHSLGWLARLLITATTYGLFIR